MMTSPILKTAVVAFVLNCGWYRGDAGALEVLAPGNRSLSGNIDVVESKRAPARLAEDGWSPYPPTPAPNADIAEEVQAAFARDPLLADNEINVRDGVGMVTLDGTVDSLFEKQHAEDLAASIRGVVTIVNGLKVRRSHAAAPKTKPERYLDPIRRQFDAGHSEPDRSATTDPELQRQVEQELRWSPFVDAVKVQVRVKRGVVTLTGVTDSEHGYRAATAMAREAGAMRVRNLMKIE